MEQFSEFKHLECVLDESTADVIKCCRKVMSGRKDAGVIRFLVSARGLQFEWVK